MGLLRLFILFILVYTALRAIRRAITHMPPPPRGPSQGPRPGANFYYTYTHSAAPPPPPPVREAAPLSPHEVLGVPRSASAQEIKQAYQALVRQYHPDKVTDLGIELRELAEKRTKEINAAYNQLKRG